MKIEIHFENENDTIDNFVLAREVYRICDHSPILNAKVVAEMIKSQYKEEYESEIKQEAIEVWNRRVNDAQERRN